MDKKTEDYRRRQKALTRGRKPGSSGLPEFEARGLGRKGKPATTFDLKRCEAIDGGLEAFFKKRRPDGTEYSVRFIKGGNRCSRTVRLDGLCQVHLEKRREEREQRAAKKAAPVASRAKPKRTQVVGRDGKEI